MPNSDTGIRNLSRTIFEKLEALPAAAYLDVCWVLCSEIDRLFADRISADSRRLMGATLDELGGAIDSAEAISESPAALDLVAEWEVLSAGQIGDEATAHIYFVFGDIANMLAGRYKIGQAHSWLLNPFVDIFQNPPRNGVRGYEHCP